MNLTMPPVEILLVEDNPGDVRLIFETLKEQKVRSHLNVVSNGMEVLPFLLQQGKYANAPRPDLILLDLNLPKKNGLEVLSEIKNCEQLKQIPVVVLSTSNDEKDILRSYELHANCYITKPVDFEHFNNVLRSIEEFWLKVVNLPREGGQDV
jgi:two-component system, chemotaxis family, response regulator Rcp1